jgi:Ca-activated chloride channel family protein
VPTTFLSPGKLWLLALVAALVAAYVALQRSRRRRAVRHPDVRLVAAVSSRWAGWRRHAVAASLAVAMISLVVGLARPAHSVEVPRDEAVVMLAVDVSGSMTATDVAPTRLAAAIAAAKQFVSGAPASFRIGLVAFDDSGHTLAPPTTNKSTVVDALDRLARGHGTAAGEGVYSALDDISAATKDSVVASDTPFSAVILLADGANTIGRPLTEAAQAAKEQHVPVYTIAYGTPNGTAVTGGKTVPVPADPAAMAEVASITGGSTFTATSGNELASVYDQIGTRIGHTVQQQELSVLFALVAMAALVLALSGAMLWNPRLV